MEDKLLVKNETILKLKDKIQYAKDMILKAIEDKRPILIRHHADADGYGAGLALEKALVVLLKEKYKEYYHRYYTRKPMKTPYYDYSDAALDIDYASEDTIRYGKQLPLFVVVDNGGTKGDIRALKRISVYGPDVIVIDHHDPGEIIDGKSEACKYVNVHINPHLVGDGSALCAGMLAAELANLLTPNNRNIAFCAAMAGIGDRVEQEIIDQYVKISGYEFDTILKIAEIIDHEAFILRPRDSPRIYYDMLGGNPKVIENMINLIYPEIQKMIDEQLTVMKKFAKNREHNGMNLAEIDLETIPRGSFPNAGKATGLLHDTFQGPTITVGLSGEFMIFRSNSTTMDVNKLINHLLEVMPYGKIDGGGHAFAGSLKFAPVARDEILAKVREFVENQQPVSS